MIVLAIAYTGFRWVLTALVLAGAVPLLAASYQYLLVALHFRRNHYGDVAPYFPRTAILIPAWNEAAVIGASIDRLMQLEYPPDALRIYVVDDASTDDTPDVIKAKAVEYPGQVVHLRREKGGEGKAHTLNHGLRIILSDDWMQALLIMDADVIYEPASLRSMTRHLADPRVGAVTAYIKEGSRPGNYLTRFIGFEYITAQAAARRSQNVLGAVACLAGGAQLHSRVNLEAIGGRIDTSSLAEDTFTTFKTQLAGEPGGVRAARHRLGRGARQHRRTVEAAAPLGPGQRPGHQAVRPSVVPPEPDAPAGQRQLLGVLVLPVPAARLHDPRLGVADHPVLLRLRDGLGRVPRAVDHQRADLRVHHRRSCSWSIRRPAGTRGWRASCSRARSACPSSSRPAFPGCSG